MSQKSMELLLLQYYLQMRISICVCVIWSVCAYSDLSVCNMICVCVFRSVCAYSDLSVCNMICVCVKKICLYSDLQVKTNLQVHAKICECLSSLTTQAGALDWLCFYTWVLQHFCRGRSVCRNEICLWPQCSFALRSGSQAHAAWLQ